jgi:hypothetical protein
MEYLERFRRKAKKANDIATPADLGFTSFCQATPIACLVSSIDNVVRLFVTAVCAICSSSGCLCKKQLDLFWHKSNILRKKGQFNFKIIVIR